MIDLPDDFRDVLVELHEAGAEFELQTLSRELDDLVVRMPTPARSSPGSR